MVFTNNDARKVKKDFPLLQNKIQGKSLIYLDNAATTQKPSVVINTLTHYYEYLNANIHRGLYPLSEDATLHYDQARKTIASFINAQPEEVIFTKNTTESLNCLAYTLQDLVGKRNEIVLTQMEHHANLVPWQQLAKRQRMVLKFIRMTKNFLLDYDDAKQKITKKTAIVAFPFVSNALGTIIDVHRLVTLSKAVGAYTVVDAAQAVPSMPLNVKLLDVDFLAFSGHKMCGPTGIGVLYGKRALLEKMPPFQTGGDMIRSVTFQTAEWNELPMKFEAGTQHIAGALGLAAAVQYLSRIGMPNVKHWEEELLRYTLDTVKKVPGIRVYNPGHGKSVGILSFTLQGIHPHDIAAILGNEGVCIRGGHHCAMPLMDVLGVHGTARASFYVYTTKEDIDAFVVGLQKVQALFQK
ncbi:SufS family cysteine desulfurase [Candidatus Woesearchaeota archaeon]|nr:SufS family cysteine desulfurase [Candidatus Woesearchaeota archaeon]